MPIYKGTTELTKIADFLTATEHDITEVYFGDQQVFTLWNEYDGTLPAQYSANGDYLADYRVYGSAGGVGDKTENIFDMSESSQGYGYQSNSIMILGGVISTQNFFISEYIPVKEVTTYQYFTDIFASSQAAYKFYKVEGGTVEFISQVLQKTVAHRVEYSPSACSSFTVPSSATHMRINVQKDARMFMIVQGSTAPAEYVPYGYELDISVRSENLFDYSDLETGSISISDGTNVNNAAQKRTENYINVSPSSRYIFHNANGSIRVHEYTLSNAWIRSVLISIDVPFVTSSNTAKIRLAAMSEAFDVQMLLCQFFTTVPIYIGDTPLGENEYVDYQAGKVYRMVNGVLTPTDPPVPLPALPTVDGVNVVDYAGQSAAVPSRFVAKYKKENF